jgi:hypothetical protein
MPQSKITNIVVKKETFDDFGYIGELEIELNNSAIISPIILTIKKVNTGQQSVAVEVPENLPPTISNMIFDKFFAAARINEKLEQYEKYCR